MEEYVHHAGQHDAVSGLIRNMRLCDDVIFRSVARKEPELMKHILELVLGKEINFKVMAAQEEFVIPACPGIRLDLYAVDGEGTEYDLEIQRDVRGAHPRRIRYYNAMMDVFQMSGSKMDADLKHIKRSEPLYCHLRDRVVIFITETDVFGKGLFRYEISNTIRGRPDIVIDDGLMTIYLSRECADDSALGTLVHDMWCSDPSEMKDDDMRKCMEYYKNTEKGQEELHSPVEEYLAERDRIRDKERDRIRDKERDRTFKEQTILSLIGQDVGVGIICNVYKDWTPEDVIALAEAHRDDLTAEGVVFPIRRD